MCRIRTKTGGSTGFKSKIFFRPFGAELIPHSSPTACAVGCNLAPLRGWSAVS